MLRALAASLLLANLVFWAWSAGLLEGVGIGPARERDPTRMAQQLHPQAVRVLSPVAAADLLQRPGAASAPGASPSCLETGPLDAGSLTAIEQVLTGAGLRDGSWLRASRPTAAVHAVVLGPYASGDALQKKREELGRLRTPFEAIDLPGDGAGAPAQPGLALGRFESRAAAEAALAALVQRGVRAARVTQLRPAGSENVLRIEAATPAQAEQLRALSGTTPAAAFVPCAPSVAAR